METIFKFIPKDSFSSKERIEGLSSQEDVQTFLRGNVGRSITVAMKLTESIPEKERLYGYYHAVILNVAMKYYHECGYHEADKVFCDYQLKAQCGKEIMYNKNTGEEEVYLLDKSRMSKDRLRMFITDCIAFLEVDCGYKVPDSASYLMEIRTGISGFMSVNQKKSK